MSETAVVTTTLTSRKERSPNFPFISLEAALRRCKEFFDAEKRGAAPATVAVKHWGYSPSSSGGVQTIAALNAYGLLVDEGRAADRKVKLSEAALRLLLDTRSESPERDQLKRAAALTPAIFADIHAAWSDDPPSDESLRHYLVLERRFTEEAARKVVSLFKQNQEFTRLYSSQTQSFDEEQRDDLIELTGSRLSDEDMRIHPASSRGADLTVHSGAPFQIWYPGPNGTRVAVIFESPPKSSDYAALIAYLELGKKLAQAEESAEGKVDASTANGT